MKILLGVLLLAVAAAANPEGGDRDPLKEKIQAMLDEAALLDQAGRPEEAARVREEAAALKAKLEGARGEKDDPRMHALANLENAIGSLEKAGYEGMAKELRGMADRLRAEVKGARGRERRDGDRPDTDFWRRNLDTLRIARKGLGEAERHDGAELLGRAIQARELMLEGKPDMAEKATREGPDDPQLAELLLVAAGCWREFKQPEKAEQCEELSRFLQHRMAERKQQAAIAHKKTEFERERPGPDDRMARVEERIDRMERMLHDALERLEERDRKEHAGDKERGGR